eukprot:TRINITY_DN13233_c0_g1_i1.p4 TRINITY_DN13233_c0_g1~~TRINITY_DN13233_c0_g1_i1.p4  ORF type:complete len:100 (+),score=32.10 TRINITY_DN13233_c0_g1_i1:514-813(+)
MMIEQGLFHKKVDASVMNKAFNFVNDGIVQVLNAELTKFGLTISNAGRSLLHHVALKILFEAQVTYELYNIDNRNDQQEIVEQAGNPLEKALIDEFVAI